MKCDSIPEALLVLLNKLDEHGEAVSHHHQHQVTLRDKCTLFYLFGERARRCRYLATIFSISHIPDVHETKNKDDGELKRSP